MEAIYCIVPSVEPERLPREKGQQGIGGTCTVRSVVICICHQIFVRVIKQKEE
jgi:hypothetical protein